MGGRHVNFIFDRNDTESGYAVRMFDHIKANYEGPQWRQLGDLRFANRLDQPSLQAADLYAHLWHAFLTYESAGMGRERNRVFQSVKKKKSWLEVLGAESFEAGLTNFSLEA